MEELETTVASIGSVLDGDGMTKAEIVEAVGRQAGPRVQEELASGWGSLLKPVAMEGELVFGPNRGRNVAFVDPRKWVGPFEPLPSDDAMREVARRWLRVHGPGSNEDLARWWGTGQGPARKALDSLGDELVEVTIEGNPARALAKDERALKAASADNRARLLGGFDPHVVGFFPRDGLVEPEFLPRVSRTAGWISPVVVVGGKPVGVWKHELRRGVAQIVVEPFGKLARARVRELSEDAERIGKALGARPSLTVV
jgi:hypothetical protein